MVLQIYGFKVKEYVDLKFEQWQFCIIRGSFGSEQYAMVVGSGSV
jgi:hypothetical protein